MTIVYCDDSSCVSLKNGECDLKEIKLRYIVNDLYECTSFASSKQPNIREGVEE